MYSSSREEEYISCVLKFKRILFAETMRREVVILYGEKGCCCTLAGNYVYIVIRVIVVNQKQPSFRSIFNLQYI